MKNMTTKEKLLELLEGGRDGFLSGEQAAAALGVSRAYLQSVDTPETETSVKNLASTVEVSTMETMAVRWRIPMASSLWWMQTIRSLRKKH